MVKFSEDRTLGNLGKYPGKVAIIVPVYFLADQIRKFET